MDYDKVFNAAIDFANMPKDTPIDYANVFLKEMMDTIECRDPIVATPELIEIIRSEMVTHDNSITIFGRVNDGDFCKYLEQYPEEFRDAIAIITILRHLVKTRCIRFPTKSIVPLLKYIADPIHASLR